MTATETPRFGALLHQYRLAAGLSQEALAERAGVSARAVSDLERGQRQAPYPRTVRQLAKALRLGADERARLLAAVPPRRGPTPLDPAAARPPTNLPAPVSSFVGRERELAEIRRLLGATRLLTLTGAGGVGKTRLALAAARAASDGYADGVWLVELAALADAALAPQAAAQALGVREQPGRPVLATLTAALKPRRLLLLLDNCEHLIDGCATLVDALLRGCPGLRVLAVSREPLSLAGEVAWPTPPLALPNLDSLPNADELACNDAVRLFVERAAAARPSFALTPQNAAAVARLCARLDGIPLALELAAARLRGLTVEQLATRLDDRFRLLTAGSRAAPPRQQTLRATVDWSYYLLTEPERALLRRLAVFAGGWTLDAAEAVCGEAGAGEEAGRRGGGDEGVDGRGTLTLALSQGERGSVSPPPGLAASPLDVLDLLLRLVDKSLVVAEERAGEARYRLLETVRQYGWERLREAGEEASVRDRHAAWALALAERAEPELHGPEQFAWFERLDAERDNLRAALGWSLAANESPGSAGASATIEAGLRLAGAVWWFWYLRDRREGVTWLERLLARGPAATPAVRAKAVFAHGCLRFDLGGYAEHQAEGRALLVESVALYRVVGDRRGLAYALSWLGRVLRDGGDVAGGDACIAEVIELAREVGDRWLIAGVIGREACSPGLTRIDDLARVLAAAEESLAIFTDMGDRLGVAVAQRRLAMAARLQGDLDRARSAFSASLCTLRAIGDRGGVLLTLNALGELAWRQGDQAGAATHFREAISLTPPEDEPEYLAESLDGLAAVEAARGMSARAARLLGAADAIRQFIGPSSAYQPAREAATGAARAALGEAAFAAAWAAGRALPPAAAAAEALADGPMLAAAATTAADRPGRGMGPLTRREAEVAGLVARGLSNRQIAAALAIAARTVGTHLTSIMAKLGLAGRVQVATWAVVHGLAGPADRA
jgi:non-specific serine/threonine protein kinase